MKSEVASAIPIRFHRGLHRVAVTLAISIFVLIVAGALVTSEDAGLSVPDWSTVQPLPSMVSTTVAHVVIGALLLAATFVLEEQLRRRLVKAPVAMLERTAARKAISA